MDQPKRHLSGSYFIMPVLSLQALCYPPSLPTPLPCGQNGNDGIKKDFCLEDVIAAQWAKYGGSAVLCMGNIYVSVKFSKRVLTRSGETRYVNHAGG